MTLLRHLVAALVAGAVIWALSVQLNAFRDFQIAEIAVYVVAIAGLSVLIGLSGQISLGKGAFMAIGAYTAALLMLHLNWPLWAVFPASAAVTALAGAVVGIAAARLSGPLPGRRDAHAGGGPAVAGDPVARRVRRRPGAERYRHRARRAWARRSRQTRWQAWVCSLAALITLVLLANLVRSRVGRNWRAIRDDPVAAALTGLNVGRLRVLAFVVSATCAGLAGAMLAFTTTLVSPGLVHAQPVDRAADRCGARRPGHPGRRDRGARWWSSWCPPTSPMSQQVTGCPAGWRPTSRSLHTGWSSSSSCCCSPTESRAACGASPASSLPPANLTRLASPDRHQPAGEQADGLASPYRHRPVSEHQEEGTK